MNYSRWRWHIQRFSIDLLLASEYCTTETTTTTMPFNNNNAHCTRAAVAVCVCVSAWKMHTSNARIFRNTLYCDGEWMAADSTHFWMDTRACNLQLSLFVRRRGRRTAPAMQMTSGKL